MDLVYLFDLVLQVLVSALFFIQKVYVLQNRKAGWGLGMVAAVLAMIYFSRIEMYIYVVLDIGLFFLMWYGFKKKSASNGYETWIRGTTGIVMLVMGYFAWEGHMTGVETISAIALSVSPYFLIHKRLRLGWCIGIIAHTTGIYLGYHKAQWVFMVFQILSVGVSIIGAARNNERTSL